MRSTGWLSTTLKPHPIMMIATTSVIRLNQRASHRYSLHLFLKKCPCRAHPADAAADHANVTLVNRAGRLPLADHAPQPALHFDWRAPSGRFHPFAQTTRQASSARKSEIGQRAHPAGVAGDAVVQAHHQHAPSTRTFLVKLIELVAQRLLVSRSAAPTRYCCKSPFASLIRKFLGRRRVFRVRMWGVT